MVVQRDKRAKARKAKVRVPHGGGAFKPGNKLAVGHDARTPAVRGRVLTQTLISILNESDAKFDKGRMYAICDKLFKRAAVDGDLEAIKYIFDRVDGKLIQPMALEDGDGHPYEFSLKIGHAGPDGDKTAAEVRLRPSMAVSKTVGGDL